MYFVLGLIHKKNDKKEWSRRTSGAFDDESEGRASEKGEKKSEKKKKKNRSRKSEITGKGP